MSFRKRNIGISDGRRLQPASATAPKQNAQVAGVRPSIVDGRPVTSTGSSNFDGLFAGHGGIALGTSVLVEESGTTEYAGALLRFFAAEGLLQGHVVHVVGMPEQWGRELPGLVTEPSKKPSEVQQDDRMKIAWRYESIDQHGTDSSARERLSLVSKDLSMQESTTSKPFCHTFDLSKRLVHPPTARLNFLRLVSDPSTNFFERAVSELIGSLSSTPPDTVHRLIVPSVMSPALYHPQSSLPAQILSFQHSLRKLLAAYSSRLVVMQTLPLSLYPRSSGLTKWIELLSDGVYNLTPFPHSVDAEFQSSRDPTTKEEPPQGLLQVYKMPLLHESGSGNPLADTDWTFTLSRRKFAIKPFNLPPIDGDTEAQQDATKEDKPKKADMDF